MLKNAVMIQGCTSDAGKSVFVAGLCRILHRKGIRVAPFKPQNMALNAAVTVDGGEIGRAQALQAYACGIEPHTDMNPVLLKPNSDTGSQIIIQGKAIKNMDFIYPRKTTKIFIPITLVGESSKTVFEATHRKPDAVIFWHLDDEYIGTTKEKHTIAVNPLPGKHSLVIVDGWGERREQGFEAIARTD